MIPHYLCDISGDFVGDPDSFLVVFAQFCVDNVLQLICILLGREKTKIVKNWRYQVAHGWNE